MAVVLQASLGAAPSPAKGDDSNVQQLKNRIHELEQETEELSRKYNEELKTERVNNSIDNWGWAGAKLLNSVWIRRRAISNSFRSSKGT